MPFTVKAHHHDEWKRNGLKDYGDFSDCIGECNQRDYGDHSSGEWFYIDENILPPMQGVDYEGKTPNEKAIYFGSWGNDNSPGASYYTNAEIFDMDNPDDVEEYNERVKEWQDAPEWLTQYSDCEECHQSFDKETMTEDDGELYCEVCYDLRQEEIAQSEGAEEDDEDE